MDPPLWIEKTTPDFVIPELPGLLKHWTLPGVLILGFLWRLPSFLPDHYWPNGDEASVGMLSIFLSSQWDGLFFHGFAQLLPALLAVEAFGFKLTQNPDGILGPILLVLSFLMVPMGYFASRSFFPKSFSLIYASLLAIGYWPLFIGRLALASSLFIFWEVFVLFCFGRFLNPDSPAREKIWALILGLALGLGSFVAIQWVVLDLCLVVTAIFILLKNPRRVVSLFLFLAAQGFISIPFLLGMIHEGFGSHIAASSFWQSNSGIGEKLGVWLNYIVSLFWGPWGSSDFYGPRMGGWLNPLADALFGWGLIRLYRARKSEETIWLAVVFLMSLLPGTLSSNLENLRIAGLLPFLLLVTAFGMEEALRTLTKSGRIYGLCLFIILSGGYDFYRYVEPSWNVTRHPEKLALDMDKTVQNFQAYQILKNQEEKEGPGFIYSEFVTTTQDYSLDLMTYSFNSAWNPKLSAIQPKWAALLTRDYYQPFLSIRFPQSQWFKLSAQIPGHNSPYLLAILPITPDNRQILQEDWKNYYLAVQKLNLQTLSLSQGKDRLGILEGYLNLQPKLPADSYLQSLLVEKLLSCYFWEKTFHPKDPDPGSLRLCQAVQKCLSRAYSIGYLYVKAGYFFDAEGEKNQARRAFEKALKLDPANSEIQQMLEKL